MSDLQIETVPVKFTTRKGAFSKLRRQLAKVSPESIELLIAQVRDTELDPKVRQSAAAKLIEYDIRIAQLDNTDQITRMLADIKYADKLLGGKTTDDDGEGKPKKPLVDFDNILTVEEIA